MHPRSVLPLFPVFPVSSSRQLSAPAPPSQSQYFPAPDSLLTGSASPAPLRNPTIVIHHIAFVPALPDIPPS